MQEYDLALDVNHAELERHALLEFLHPRPVVIDGKAAVEMTVRAEDDQEAEAYVVRRLEQSLCRPVKVLRCLPHDAGS